MYSLGVRSFFLLWMFAFEVVNGCSNQNDNFCDSYKTSNDVQVVANRFCRLDESEKNNALQCSKISSDAVRDIVKTAKCFKGITGEKELEGMIQESSALKLKVRGPCGDVCQKKVEETRNQTIELGKKIENVFDKKIEKLRNTSTLYVDLKTAIVERPSNPSGIETFKEQLDTRVESLPLNKDEKKEVKTDVLKRIIAVTNVTVQQNILPNIAKGLTVLIESYNKTISATVKDKQKLQKNLDTAKKYIKNFGDYGAKTLDKVLPALQSAHSAMAKFSDGSTVNVISGILDVASAISNFLPEPAGSIMAPLTAIFNVGFGIGRKPTAIDVINEGFRKQKQYLEKEFKALNAKMDAHTARLERKMDYNTKRMIWEMNKLADEIIDGVSDNFKRIELLEERIFEKIGDSNLQQIRNSRRLAMDEVLKEQQAIEEKLRQMNRYLSSIDDTALENDDIVFLGAQINIFEGVKENVKTMEYIKTYCRGKSSMLLDETQLRMCTGLLYHWSKASVLSDGVMIKFIALMRLSNMDQIHAVAKLEVLNLRKANRKSFLETIFHDSNDYCSHGGYGIFGCLAQGHRVMLDENKTFNMTQDQRDSFEKIAKGVNDNKAFSCADKWITNCGCANLKCKNDGHCAYNAILNSPECKCRPGYHGNNCKLNYCDRFECNSGQCIIDDNNNKPKCNCTSSYYGDRCQYRPDYLVSLGGETGFRDMKSVDITHIGKGNDKSCRMDNLPEAVSGHATAQLKNHSTQSIISCGGEIFVGQKVKTSKVTNECHQLSLKPKAKWTKFSSMKFARKRHSLTQVGDFLIAIGGHGDYGTFGPQLVHSFEYINIKNGNQWTSKIEIEHIPIILVKTKKKQTKELMLMVYEHCTVPISDQEIMVIGGHWMKHPSDKTRILDINGWKWNHDGPKLNKRRQGHACTILKEGSTKKIYVVGGRSTNHEDLTSLETMTLNEKRWTLSGSQLPIPLKQFQVVVANSPEFIIYAIGGFNEFTQGNLNKKTVSKKIYALTKKERSFEHDFWQQVASLKAERSDQTTINFPLHDLKKIC